MPNLVDLGQNIYGCKYASKIFVTAGDSWDGGVPAHLLTFNHIEFGRSRSNVWCMSRGPKSGGELAPRPPGISVPRRNIQFPHLLPFRICSFMVERYRLRPKKILLFPETWTKK